MSRVLFKKATYDYSVLRPAVFTIIESVNKHLIKPDSRVLLKPNLLAPASPDKAMLTHPLVIRAVSEYVLEKGGKVQISDSPAMGTLEKVLTVSGIKEALAGLDVEYKEFEQSVSVDIGPPFNRIEIAEDVFKADVIINLPKLKTHAHMLLTLGVKNLFGCIVGFRKPEWHFRTGIDREMFATLLVKIHDAVRPPLTLLDGILGMEGQGPGRSGNPRQIGILAASEDAVSLDRAVCRILKIEPDELLTNKMACQMVSPRGPLEIQGEFPNILNINLPRITSLVFGPKPLQGFIRRHLSQRPEPDNDLCKLCGECWKYCPAKAIGRRKRKLSFAYDKCIRCYCCIEVCPHGALTQRDTLPGRVMKRILEKNLRHR